MWHNSQDQHRQQSPPGAYNHRQTTQNTMSDRMSVSSGTTIATSQLGGHHHPNYNNSNHHQIIHQVVHQVPQSPNPNNYHTASPTYFYPSSRIHNAPHQVPNPLSQHPPNMYTSSLHEPPPVQPPPSLTSVLLSSSVQQLTLATRHPFLRAAGRGHIPKAILSRWLSQDRLYAQSYIGFIGSLIARVDLPYVHMSDKSSSLRWRIVTCLTSALQNIHTELQFFDDTAQKYGLNLESSSRADGMFTADPATKQYIDLFRAFWTDPSMSLLEGMVVLWATETVYWRAWSYAKSFINASTNENRQMPDDDRDRKTKTFSASELEGSEVVSAVSGNTGDAAVSQSNTDKNDTPSQPQPQSPNKHSTDPDGGALRDAFIPNWTSTEFQNFVAEIAELTDLLAEREDAVSRRVDVYKAVWRHILDVERRFWPDIGVSD